MAARKKIARRASRALGHEVAPRKSAKSSAQLLRKKDASSAEIDIRTLRESFGLTRKLFSRLSNYSERAIAGWEGGAPLTAVSAKRITELVRLQQALAGVMEEDFIGEWLQAPNAAFGGLKPLEVIERGESDRLWRMIYQLESGVPG